jgi:hypothetical protein
MIRTAITDFRVKIIHLAVKQSDRAAQLNFRTYATGTLNLVCSSALALKRYYKPQN